MSFNLKNILSAWSQSLTGGIPNPENYPEWYRMRMEACESCKYNTVNMSDEEVKDVALWKRLFGSKRGRCSLCGCFVREKAWVRSERCSIFENKEIMDKEPPRWNKLEDPCWASKHFSIKSDNTDVLAVGERNNGHDFWAKIVKPLKVDEEVKVRFKIESKKNIVLGNPQLSCGCIRQISFDKEDRRNIYVNLVVSTQHFRQGPFERNILVRFTDDLNKPEKALRVYIGGDVSNEYSD